MRVSPRVASICGALACGVLYVVWILTLGRHMRAGVLFAVALGLALTNGWAILRANQRR
jgi:hypothetical protein